MSDLVPRAALEAALLNVTRSNEYAERAGAELAVARTALDRAAIVAVKLHEQVRELEEENEALRNQVAVLALASGGGGTL